MPNPKFKRMLDYSDDELTAAIDEARALVSDEHFYGLLRGIDAYMEKRKRRDKKSAYGSET